MQSPLNIYLALHKAVTVPLNDAMSHDTYRTKDLQNILDLEISIDEKVYAGGLWPIHEAYTEALEVRNHPNLNQFVREILQSLTLPARGIPKAYAEPCGSLDQAHG